MGNRKLNKEGMVLNIEGGVEAVVMKVVVVCWICLASCSSLLLLPLEQAQGKNSCCCKNVQEYIKENCDWTEFSLHARRI